MADMRFDSGGILFLGYIALHIPGHGLASASECTILGGIGDVVNDRF